MQPAMPFTLGGSSEQVKAGVVPYIIPHPASRPPAPCAEMYTYITYMYVTAYELTFLKR